MLANTHIKRLKRQHEPSGLLWKEQALSDGKCSEWTVWLEVQHWGFSGLTELTEVPMNPYLGLSGYTNPHGSAGHAGTVSPGICHPELQLMARVTFQVEPKVSNIYLSIWINLSSNFRHCATHMLTWKVYKPI